VELATSRLHGHDGADSHSVTEQLRHKFRSNGLGLQESGQEHTTQSYSSAQLQVVFFLFSLFFL
jgi:hypothetical protein